jgi:hypothetical protein
MWKYAGYLPVVVLAPAIYVLAVAQAAPAPAGAANAAVEKVADAVNNPAQFKKLAAGLATNFDLLDIATAFKPREKDGLGVGPKSGPIDPDGIQLKLIQMAGKKAIDNVDLKANRADYQRMAEVTRGIAEAMPGFAPKFAKGPALKKWNGFADDMQKGSDDLIAAIKGNDLLAIKKAAGKLNQSCDGCHAATRDAP